MRLAELLPVRHRFYLRFALRCVNPRPCLSRKSLLQAWTMQQPALAVDVLQSTDRPWNVALTAIQDHSGLFLGDQIAMGHRLLELRPGGR